MKNILTAGLLCSGLFAALAHTVHAYDLIAPSSSWSGTVGSGGGTAPTDPTRTTFKPVAHFTIVPYQDVTGDFDVPVMAFAKGGIEKVRFHVEGNTVDVYAPSRYTGHEGRPYEAYVVTLDESAFPAQDGAFRVYAEVFPRDPYAQKRVISIDLYFNGGGTLPGTGVEVYVDSRATLTTGSPITVTAGNRLVGQTSGTMAIVVTSATNATSLTVSPMSLDGGVTRPEFTNGETVAEVLPDGTATGNASTVSGALSYNGALSGTYPAVGTSGNPFWHLKAAADAVSVAGHPKAVRTTYYFKDGSYHLFGVGTGSQNNAQYVHFVAASDSNPTLDFGLSDHMYLSYVDQHIKGFTFRKIHSFTGSQGGVNIGSGADAEYYWLDHCTWIGDAASASVMGGPGNGGNYFFTDSSSEDASFGISAALVRNVTIDHSTHDAFSHSSAVINSSAINMEQIYPSHSDVYQFEVGSPAENILLYGLQVTDNIVVNAGLFLTGEGGSGNGSFRDVAVVNYLTEAQRDDLHNDYDHVVLLNNTMSNTGFGLGVRGDETATSSIIAGNWINRMSINTDDSVPVLAGTVFDSNNFAHGSSHKPGTNVSEFSAAASFASNGSDYTPTGSMPTMQQLALLDANGNYRSPTTAIGAYAASSESQDTTVPTISSISAGTPAATSAAVTWSTNEQASSYVEYGPTASYGLIASNALLKTSHSLDLTDLTSGQTYHYRVISRDFSGNARTSSDQTFTTAGGSSGGSSGSSSRRRSSGGGSSRTSRNAAQQPAAPAVAQSPQLLLTKDLYMGMADPDVLKLQKHLNASGFVIALQGPGSPGSESDYFGNLTRDAVMKYQLAKGIVPATGYVGALTRASLSNSAAPQAPIIPVSVPQTNQSPSTRYVFSEPMYLGYRSAEVAILQQFLIDKGYLPAGNASGFYGPLTRSAVGAFQLQQGIVKSVFDDSYGLVGPNTRAKLNALQ